MKRCAYCGKPRAMVELYRGHAHKRCLPKRRHRIRAARNAELLAA